MSPLTIDLARDILKLKGSSSSTTDDVHNTIKAYIVEIIQAQLDDIHRLHQILLRDNEGWSETNTVGKYLLSEIG